MRSKDMARLKATGLKALPLVLLMLWVPGPVHGQDAELTAERYCLLTKSLMELTAREWKDRIETAKGLKRSPRKEMVERLDSLANQYRKSQNRLYRQFGIGRSAYLSYASDHKIEIESFLEDHQDVKGEIDSIKDQINGLIQKFESVMANRQEGEQH